MIEQLRHLTSELRLDPAAANVRFLEDQVADAEKRVATAQAGLTHFQQAYQIVDLPSQAKVLAEQYAGLQKDAATAQLEAQVAMRQANLLSSNVKNLVASAIDPAPGPGNTLGPLYQRVKQTQAELALLRYRLTDEHPEVKEKQQALQEAQRQLQAETQRQLGAVQSGATPALSQAVVQAAGSQARAAGLQTALAGLRTQVQALPQQEAGYAQLSGKLEAEMQSLKLYRQELEKARILAQSHGPVFEVLDAPEPAREPDSSHRGAILLLALLAAGCIGLSWPYWEWRQGYSAYEEALLARHPDSIEAGSATGLPPRVAPPMA